jgi:hypothetical protein
VCASKGLKGKEKGTKGQGRPPDTYVSRANVSLLSLNENTTARQEIKRRSHNNTHAQTRGGHACHGPCNANPKAAGSITPPSQYQCGDAGDLSASPHVTPSAARHIARAFLSPRHGRDDATPAMQMLWRAFPGSGKGTGNELMVEQ